MQSKFISLVALIALVSFGLIFVASQEATTPVLTPQDLIAPQPNTPFKRIRVGGRVVRESIVYSLKPTPELRFRIFPPGGQEESNVPVLYRGIKPDALADGRDVIIDGDFNEGVLVAANLNTQCPSKYEPPSPEQKYSIPKMGKS